MRNLLLLLLLVPALLPAQINSDSLWQVWNNTEAEDTTRLLAIKGLVQYRYLFSQPDTAFEIAQTMYDYALAQERESWMDMARNYQGISLAIRGRHQEAIGYFNECLELSERLGNQSRIAGSLNNIGLLHKEIGDLEQAIQYLTRALDMYEEIDDINGQALTTGNISVLHSKLGNTDEILPLAERSYELFKQLGDTKGTGNALSSLGTYYASMADTAKVNGEMALANERYDEALDYYEQALVIRRQAGDLDGIAVTTHGMGMIYGQLGQTGKAVTLIEESLDLARQVGSPSSIRNGASELHYLYKKQGRYREALEMLEEYQDVNEMLLSEENQRAVIRQEYQFQYDQQALADSLAKAEESLQVELAYQTELRKKDQLRNGLLMLSALVLLVSLGLWSRNRYIKASNEKLAIAKDRAERSEQFKEQFLANMSHEIRTPMHAISGMLKILRRRKHPANQEPYLQAMQTSADNLVVLLNDVLDMSKIEAGQLEVEQLAMNPREVLNNVLQILKFKAEEKGLRLQQEVDTDLPELIIGDPTRLSQILTNLLSNAIKFTDNGYVKVALAASGENYEIRVQDTGIGIAADQLDNVFGEFVQATSNTTRLYGGTGLGLSITKHLVELQSGRISVESEEGVGSTFLVRLPLQVATEAANQTLVSDEQLKEMAGALKGIRILLAEDNEFNQMIARDDLLYYIEDVQITTVETGTQAVAQFQTETHDLILMDVQMPEMNGQEATTRIRQLEAETKAERSIPIIAMTASLLKAEIKTSLASGMDSYIPKPYQPAELIGEIYKAYTGNS